jgi:hypothetical protein
MKSLIETHYPLLCIVSERAFLLCLQVEQDIKNKASNVIF